MSMSESSGQVWSFDLMVAFVIFSLGLIVFYLYAVNSVSSESGAFEELSLEADLVSSLLILDPDVGIVSDGKINKTKLNEFDSLGGPEKKARLGVSDNFYFTFQGLDDRVGIVNSTPMSYQVSVKRISIYEGRPVKFEVVSWR